MNKFKALIDLVGAKDNMSAIERAALIYHAGGGVMMAGSLIMVTGLGMQMQGVANLNAAIKFASEGPA